MELKDFDSQNRPVKKGVFKISTSPEHQIVNTRERFMDQVILGNHTFNRLARNGYASPTGPNGEYQGIDKDKLRADLAEGNLTVRFGDKAMKRIQELLSPTEKK